MRRIRLQGQIKDVLQAENQVRERLHKVKEKHREEEEALILTQFVCILHNPVSRNCAINSGYNFAAISNI